MSSEQEIIRIGKHLEKISSSDTPVRSVSCSSCLLYLWWALIRIRRSLPPPQNDEQALDMLKALQKCSMSLDVLQVRDNAPVLKHR